MKQMSRFRNIICKIIAVGTLYSLEVNKNTDMKYCTMNRNEEQLY
jgi:hypothetical protein